MTGPGSRSRGLDAVVVGSGPNGLAAAIELARAGRSVHVIEAADTLGGGIRTSELTLPGFRHDLCSTVVPLAAGSPFFRSVDLARHGVEWVHPPVALAHLLRPDRRRAPPPLARGDGHGAGSGWTGVGRAAGTARAGVGPPRRPRPRPAGPIPAPPAPAGTVRTPVARARDDAPAAGLPGGARPGVVHGHRRPLDGGAVGAADLRVRHRPRDARAPLRLAAGPGGIGRLAEALVAESDGARRHVRDGPHRALAGRAPAIPGRRPRPHTAPGPGHRRRPSAGSLPWRPGALSLRAGVFKVDWALDGPVPWRDPAAAGAGTVHLAGTSRAVAAAEDAVARGRHPERPFILFVQPTVADPTRAPAGKHVAWAYCHVPNGSTVDMTAAIEAQVERHAPGFRDVILARAAHGAGGDGGARRELRRRRHQRRAPGPAAGAVPAGRRAGTRTRRRSEGCSCARRRHRRAAACTA